MDINHIELPAGLLADFYRNHLVETVAAKAYPVSPAANEKQGVQYLGKNQKGICLLVHYPKDVYLPDGQLDFLTTILQACRLNLGDVAIVNHYREKITFDEIKHQLNCHYLLVFGIEPVSIGLSKAPFFTTQHTADCQVVFAPSAEQLNNNNAESKLLKSKLWVCLKQMFSV